MDTQTSLKILKQVECRDSTYMPKSSPLVFHKAKGSLIWDAEGSEYVDLCAGFGVLSLGHNSEVQSEVLSRSINEEALVVHGMGDVYASTAKAELFDCMRSMLPSYLSRGALALSGGQSIEIAVKTAQLATKKVGFITFQGSYHGLDLGILALTSRQDFKSGFIDWIQHDRVIELPFGCPVSQIKDAIEKLDLLGYGCAAVVVEPIQGRAGFRLPPNNWLNSVSYLVKEHKTLLIYDEVFTGLGRSGRITFAEEAPCDLLCLGKALGGGLPLSACFGTEEVMAAWPQNEGEAIHTGTFFGHPLSCRLGKATLEAILSQDLISRSREFGERIRHQLREVLHGLTVVREIRGDGMMTCIELIKPGLGAIWMDRLRSKGVVALANGMEGQGIAITPALNIPENIWGRTLPILRTSLEALQAEALSCLAH